MSDKNTYQWMPDNEMLRRFYEGKLSASEQSALSAMFEKDEFLREAFANVTAKEFDVVESISLSVNDKLRKVVGKPALYMRWQIWLSVFVGVILITGFVAMSDWKEEKIVAQKKEEKNKEHRTKSNDHQSSNGSVSNEIKFVSATETTMMFDSPDEKEEKKVSVQPKDTLKNEKKISEEKKVNQDGPADNKVDLKTKNQNSDPTTLDPGKKTYRLRIGDAAVIQTENLAEKEANAGEDRSNMDVRNVNIGDAATTKKNKSYNLEDMPQFKGGNEALAGYVKGKIALKSYTLNQSNVSTVVEFVVTSKGKVEDIQFQNPLDPAMEKDIKEVLSSVTFSPGKKSGKKGSLVYRMAMMFE